MGWMMREKVMMQMKKKPLVLALVAGLVLPLALGGCGGKEQRLAEHMKKGTEFYEQGDYDKARVEFKNVLQIDPKSAEGYYRFAEVEERQQNWQRAFGYYSKAVELDPNHLAAKAKIGRMYLMVGDLANADKTAGEILAKQPMDPRGRTLKAAVMARKGDVEGAMREVAEVTADLSQTDAVSLLSGLYGIHGDEAKAIELLEKAIQANPKNIILRVDLANIAIKRQDYAKAEKLLQEIITIDPKKMEYRVQVARFYTQTKQLDKAEKVLRDAIQVDPDDEQRYLLLADFLASNRSGEAAEKELVAWTQAKPKAYKLRYGLAKLYEAMGKPDDAGRVYKEVIDRDKTGPDGLRARNLLARLDLARGAVGDAEKLTAEVLKENPRDNDALTMRAKLALSRGDAKAAVVDLRAVLKDQPDSVEVLTLLARAHMANGEPKLAQEVFDSAVNQYPNHMLIRFARADFLASQQEYEAAMKDVDAILEKDPKNAQALQAKAEVAAGMKDWAVATEYLTRVKAALPNQPDGYYRQGLVYEAQKKYDEAAAEYEAALSRAPTATEPLRALVRIKLAKGKPDQAIMRVNQSLQAVPGNAGLQLLLAEVYANQKQYKESEAVVRKLLQANPRVPEGYLALANLAIARNDLPGAAQSLQQGLDAVGPNASLSVALAEVFQRQNQADKAVEQYEAVLARDPGNLVAANNAAALLSEAKGDQKSLEQALRYASRFENTENPIYLDTLGWVYFKLGQYDRARPLIEKATQKAPDIGVFQYHLGMTVLKQGDAVKAKSLLQSSLQAKVPFKNADEVKATLARM
jgi:tetratricopeptide (TPR) repeat protein